MLVFSFGYKYFNILKMLMGTQHFHDTRNSWLVSYICLCMWHSVKGKKTNLVQCTKEA